MGGASAKDITTILPGAIFPVLSQYSCNGSWISVQDYRGLTVEQATQRAYDIGDLEEASLSKKFNPNDTVKSCYKLESGLRLGQEGIHACQLGPPPRQYFHRE